MEKRSNSDTEDWVPEALPIPSHWAYANFETAFENISLTGLKIPQKEYRSSGDFPVVDQGNELIGGYTNHAGKIVKLKRDSIVFGDHTKCFKYVNYPFAPGADGVKVLVPREPIIERFAYYACKSLRLPDRGYSRHYSFLKKSKFPLAPVGEQHRIVAKIEELFSELDRGIESLKTAREQLKIYRQAVLKHAFEGKLTAQWREDNKGKLETADQLLARIQKERAVLHQQQLEEWKDAVNAWKEKGKEGQKPKRPKVLNPLRPPTAEELVELPKLPEDWTWIRPEEIAAQEDYAIGIGPFGSNLKVSDYRERGVPLIFVRNITRFDFTFNLKYVDHEKYLELIAHTVKPLDLVITKMGDPPGDCEVYPENSPEAVLTADCLKFRLWQKFADRRFYRNCINSNLIKKQFGLITKGVAQKKISVDRFKTIFLPFMCTDEQNEVAGHLDEILSILDQQNLVISESLLQAEVLRQSILKKAFSGQLVEQDPDDEPASVLLKRIKAEKAQHQLKPRKKAVKRKAATGVPANHNCKIRSNVC